MSETRQKRQFCEQCGAYLGKDVKFCESCGHPVASEGKTAERQSTATRSTNGKRGLMVAGALSLLLIIGALGWWLGRGQSNQPAANPDQNAVVPLEDHPALSDAKAGENASANPARQPSQPTKKEQPLSTWLNAQPWFLTLSKSMPAGVSLSIVVHESEDPRWNMVEIREVHSPESGFDPDVSPTVGIFRVSTDRRITKWLDPVLNDWDSTGAFLSSRGSDTGQPAPATPTAGAAEVHAPAPGTPERKEICDAMRDHVIRDNRDRALPKFLFKVEFIRVSGDHAGFQGFPVKSDGKPLPDGIFEDMVHTTLLKKRNGVWNVVVDLSRSDVPTAEEVRDIRKSIPTGFPTAVMPDFWRNLLKP